MGVEQKYLIKYVGDASKQNLYWLKDKEKWITDPSGATQFINPEGITEVGRLLVEHEWVTCLILAGENLLPNGLESGNTNTSVIENKKYSKEKPSTYRLICCAHRKADGKRLAEFQEEYCNLIREGVPPQEIVKNWNDAQDSFWNKVYLINEGK